MTALEETLATAAQEAGAGQPVGGEFSRDGRPFAHVAGIVAEFRLDPEIADAALGTPSTSSSARGPEWVGLSVDASNPHDLDRARAWFLSAFRYAERRR